MIAETRRAAPAVAANLLALATLTGAAVSPRAPLTSGAPPPAGAPTSVTWTLDRLNAVGGHVTTLVGAPRVVETAVGRAVEFDGANDGLLVDVNPVAGMAQFTVEALIEPAPDGPPEQRFLHLSEDGSDRRVMMETRLLPDRSWCLDTYVRDEPPGLTLIDRTRTHDSGAWHAVALTYDGRAMAHYVNGAREAVGEVAFTPLRAGRTSIGVRLNRVSWFKGKIRLLRFTAAALPEEDLLKVPMPGARPRIPGR